MSDLTIAIVAGVVAMLFWGIPDIFAKKAVDEVGNYIALVYTNIFLVLLTIPLFLFHPALPEDMSLLGLLPIIPFGLFDFIAFVLFYKSFTVGKASVMTPITSSYAVFAAIVSYFVFGEVFSTLKIFAFALVTIGIIFAAVKFSELKASSREKGLANGIQYAIWVPFIYALYIPFWDKYIETDGWLFLSLSTRVVTLICALVATVFIQKQKLKIKRKDILLWLSLNGVLLTIGNTVYNWGLSSSDQTSVTSAISSAYPLPLAIGAYFLLKERLELNQYIGVIFIIAGIVLMALI